MGKKQTNERNSFKQVPCIIALDQSYSRTGIAICIEGTVKVATYIDFKGVLHHAEKRHMLKAKLEKAINSCLKHYSPSDIVVLVERIRTFTGSDSVRPEVIKSHAALIACIVDTAYLYEIKVFSVDTRAWKSKVLGSSKPVFEPIAGVKNPQKFGSVRKAISLGFEKQLRVRRGRTKEETTTGYNKDGSAIGAGVCFNYNDDMADAICMSLYTFKAGQNNLKLET